MIPPKNALKWFEIPVADFERARAFYSTILAYQMPEFPMGPTTRMGILPYVQGEGVGGAIVLNDAFKPAAVGTVVYLSGGDDLQVVLDRIPAAGGKAHTPKFQVSPDIGFCAYFQDTEGNLVGLHSPH